MMHAARIRTLGVTFGLAASILVFIYALPVPKKCDYGTGMKVTSMISAVLFAFVLYYEVAVHYLKFLPVLPLEAKSTLVIKEISVALASVLFYLSFFFAHISRTPDEALECYTDDLDGDVAFAAFILALSKVLLLLVFAAIVKKEETSYIPVISSGLAAVCSIVAVVLWALHSGKTYPCLQATDTGIAEKDSAEDTFAIGIIGTLVAAVFMFVGYMMEFYYKQQWTTAIIVTVSGSVMHGVLSYLILSTIIEASHIDHCPLIFLDDEDHDGGMAVAAVALLLTAFGLQHITPIATSVDTITDGGGSSKFTNPVFEGQTSSFL